MKTLLLAALSCSFVATATAQPDYPNEIWLSAGFSMPLSDYGAVSASGISGYAKTGAYYRFNYQHNVSENFGITMMLGVQSNPIDVDVLAQRLGPNVTSEKRSWTTTGFHAGIAGRLPLGSWAAIEGRAAVGFANINFGGLRHNYSSGDWIDQSSSNSVAFSYLAGTAFKLYIGERLMIPLTFDLTGANGTFNNITISHNGIAEASNSFSMNVSSWNTSIGIGVRL